jgi:hypothetical protein
MTPTEIVLYVLLVVTGLGAFGSFLFVKSKYASPWTLGGWLVAFGLVVGVSLSRQLIYLPLFGTPTDGVVEELIPKWKTGLKPAVRFRTADGEEARFVCRQGVSAGVYAVGQTVPVYYDPADPSFGIVATWPSLGVPLLSGGLLALVPILLGGYLLRRSRGRS